MAHKTLIGGTAYNVVSGTSLVSGTQYNIVGGKTLVDGTGYDINLGSNATAMLYDDGSFVFQDGDEVAPGKSLVNSYTDFEEGNTGDYGRPCWNEEIINFTSVSFDTEVAPTSMAYWFYGAENMVANISNFNNLKMDNLTDMGGAYYYCRNITGSPVCGDNVTDFRAYWYCSNLTGSPVCGPNVTSIGYGHCYNLTGSPVCSDKITSLSQTYCGCHNLTGSPVCGNNVTSMYEAYQDCYNLTGSPVCGPNVTKMSQAYQYCYNLTGSPVCGDKVTSMFQTYLGCRNLTGSPVCGPNVNDMYLAYSDCYNLTGSPVCGDKVTDMGRAYEYCYNLTGSPVCGPNVTNMRGTYKYCYNLKGNAYFYSPSVVNMLNCFEGRNTLNRLNIYVKSGSVTNTTIHYTNSDSIVGNAIKWTNRGSYQYNSYYNIYIYPVSNVYAIAPTQPNTNSGDLTAMLYSDGSLVFQRGSNVAPGKSLVASYTDFENTTNPPWNGRQNSFKSVSFDTEVSPTDMGFWFFESGNLTGNIRKFNNLNMDNVINMSHAFYYCPDLTGSPICGDNVRDMHSAYGQCDSLTGSPVCGKNVTNMAYAYTYCSSLTGSPVCGDNVTNMRGTYSMCSSINGPAICGYNVKDISFAYIQCYNLTRNAYFYSPVVSNVKNCFSGIGTSKRLNIYVPANSTTNTTIHYTNSDSIVGSNITWVNRGSYQYNNAYNIYIYPVANVAAARAANRD